MNIKTIAALLSPQWLKSDYLDREPPQKEERPAGPMKLATAAPVCSMLIYVPRNAISALIDDTTGGYGYSHLALDCGEIDVPTGRPVMIESTVGSGVHYSFQDEYGERKYVRIPLEGHVVNAAEFCDCLRAKLGEKFDDEEALSGGLIDNPAKQICSDLATVCLPETVRVGIARYHEAGVLHVLSAVREYHGPNEQLRLFVSPNGFAQYFGAPRGSRLTDKGQVSKPILRF
jgi:hypothetical protein